MGNTFKTELLPQGLQFGAGALAGLVIRTKVINRFLPSTSTGWQSYLAGFATAIPLLMVPKYGKRLAVGAVGAELIRFAMDKGGPILHGIGLGELACDNDMAEYATVGEMRRATMAEYATVGEMQRLLHGEGMAEYATVAEVENAVDGGDNPTMY